MRHIDDDFEIEAIDKCSRALSKLDDKTKIRVIKYLLDKFGLLVQNENQPKEVVSQNIQYQQNNLVLAEPKDISNIPKVAIRGLQSGGTMALKDILIKNLAKTEPELLIIIAYYNSTFGQSTFTRQSLLDSYKEHGVSTETRRKNLSSNLNSLIKKYYISTITDEEYSISEEGCEYATNILGGNTNTKKRKPRLRKNKSNKKDNSSEVELNEVEADD